MNITDLSQWTQQDFSHLVTAAVVVLTGYVTAWINRPHWSSTVRTLVAFGVASALTVLKLWGMGELDLHRLPWLVFVVFLSASVLYKTILRGPLTEFENATSAPVSNEGVTEVPTLPPPSADATERSDTDPGRPSLADDQPLPPEDDDTGTPVK